MFFMCASMYAFRKVQPHALSPPLLGFSWQLEGFSSGCLLWHFGATGNIAADPISVFQRGGFFFVLFFVVLSGFKRCVQV
jgi:hypothetical protein